jgi:imidazolonepropionase-like amidohydrolase
MMMQLRTRALTALALSLAPLSAAHSLQQPSTPAGTKPVVLVPDAVWTGTSDVPERGWVVVVRGNRIEAAGPAAGVTVPADAERVALPGTTLIPGLIEGHSHLFLHP